MRCRLSTVYAAAAVALLVASLGVPAKEQSILPDTGGHTGAEASQAIALTRDQELRIQHASSDLQRLERSVTRSRQKLVALQLAALPEKVRADHPASSGLEIAVIMSGISAMPGQYETVGFELGDVVAFTRPNDKGVLEITGIGTVSTLSPDDMMITITASGHPGIVPLPEDVAYIISRDDSPYSLAKHKL